MTDAHDDRIDQAAHALRASLPDIDAGLDDRVMAAIQSDHAADRTDTHRGVRWIFEPRTVRIRPVWAGLAAAAIIALFLVPRPRVAPQAPAAAVTAMTDTVYVHFSLSAPAAHNVSLAGSFNNWDAAGLSLHRAADGGWEATIALPVGEHRYQFVVDGRRWVPDPAAQAQVDDGFGGTNSVIVVGPKGVVKS